MADTHDKPGIALIFGDEIWYIAASDLDDVNAKIDSIKEVLVGANGIFAGKAVKLSAGDYLDLSKLEHEDIKGLLTKGITIRPLGR